MSKLSDCIERYKKIEEIIPGFKWGDDTEELLKAAKCWEVMMGANDQVSENMSHEEIAILVLETMMQALNLYKAAPENEFDRVIGPVAKSYAQEE